MMRIGRAIIALAFVFGTTGVSSAEVNTTPSDGISADFDVAQASGGFDRWRQSFRRKALRAGIRAQVFDTAFAGVSYNARVVELDGKQPEFTRTLWDYVNRVVSTDRVNEGRTKARALTDTLGQIKARYGVDPQVVIAIWGIETNFGGFMGGTNVIESLATLAFDGRRRDFAERELIAALSIIQSGDTIAQNMEGSWAGAMGHTQFMPTSYLAYADDFTGDGRRDLWANDPSDALASTANYLRLHGWTKDQPWGIEVRVPAGFDYSLANPSPGRPVSDWNRLGVRTISGEPVPNYANAGLWTPAGASGPAFIVYPNFFVIKRYNRADSYALAVGHLGDRIFGATAFQAAWPNDTRALSRAEKRLLQSLLTQNGFNTRGVDGRIGPNTITAIRAFQRSKGLVPDGYASPDLLRRLR